MSDNLTLCITVRFLSGTYHGRDRDGGQEWPPSPLRLFQALVAAAGGRRTDAERDALRWLEGQFVPPDILAPEPRAIGGIRKHYVPNNDADRQSDHVGSRVEKTFRPLHLPDRAEVQYRWPITEADRPHAGVLAQLAGRLRCLGWGIDVVAGRGGYNCGEPAGARRWVPGEVVGSGIVRRVPCDQTLKSLDDAHADKAARFDGGRYRPSDANVTTRTVSYAPAGGLPARSLLAFSLVTIADGARASFWPAKVAELAGQVRHVAKLAARRCEWDRPTIDSYVCGHDAKDGNRLAFLPLPSIGHPHTDGMIRRVLLVAPPGDNDRLNQLRPRLIGPLQPEDGEPTVAIVPMPDDNVIRRYTGVARMWSTVTPAILPGHISRRGLGGEPFTLDASELGGDANTSVGRKAARVAVRLLELSDIPVNLVEQITFGRVPHPPNLPHAMRFTLPCKMKTYQRAHVHLAMKQPVAGPLAVGLGRFRGFGLLAACDAN